MAKYLLEVVETYRVDTDEEAEALVAENKEDSSFILAKYNIEKKEKKSKGEVIDEGVCVKLTKKYASFWEV